MARAWLWRLGNWSVLVCVTAIIALLASPQIASAHGTERGLVMLLPTDYYLKGGAIAVAASFVVLLLVPASWFGRLSRASFTITGLRLPPVSISSTVVALFILMLVAIGRFSTADPLENPLPLFVWIFFWVAFPLVQAVIGNLWPWLNPWSGPLALLRRATGKPFGINPLARLPESVGYVPAMVLFLAFAWFELVSLAPEDPPRLAVAVSLYCCLNFAAMIIFGEEEWTRRGEPFSVYFRMIGLIAPLSFSPPPESGKRTTLAISWPGQRCVTADPPSVSAAIFLLITLGTASFDGFSETFIWLASIGINPLEFPGRSAVTIENTFGLLAAPVVLGIFYFDAVAMGALLAGRRQAVSMTRLAAHLIQSIVPISVAFHAAHYLSLFLINSQYLYAVISDPLGLGWDLFGTAEWHVTASFLTNLDGVQLIWAAQTAIIVGGHCVGIFIAHMIALRYFEGPHRATLSQFFLAVVMVFYTVFGLWLLSTPSAG